MRTIIQLKQDRWRINGLRMRKIGQIRAIEYCLRIFSDPSSCLRLEGILREYKKELEEVENGIDEIHRQIAIQE